MDLAVVVRRGVMLRVLKEYITGRRRHLTSGAVLHTSRVDTNATVFITVCKRSTWSPERFTLFTRIE